MYFDEFLYMRETIEERKAQHYLMLTSIAQNPHTQDPLKLFDALEGKMLTHGKRPPPEREHDYIENTELDKNAFAALKGAMRGNPRIIIKE